MLKRILSNDLPRSRLLAVLLAAILGLGAFYSAATGAGLPAFGAITLFGAVVVVMMALICRWHRHNQGHHTAELERLLELARSDRLHR